MKFEIAETTGMLKILEQKNQKHLLKYFNQLDEDHKRHLVAQLEKIEWDNLDQWIENHVKNDSPLEVPDHFEPADYYPASPSDDDQSEFYKKASARGEQMVAAGKVAAFVVAGGQGTRLGFDGPKGCYKISPVKDKMLFQLFSENILSASKKYNTAIPLYIMTSPLNYDATVEAFEENNYFGLKKEDVFFFQQGTLPNFSFDGKILANAKDSVAASPDGHGGSLKALYVSGAIADMKKRGIEQISYFQVDNPLIKIIDPLFIGLHAMAEAQMSSKALKKAYPKEKVGNFCMVNGKVTVIEYSDLPDEFAEKRNIDDSLVFELGSIAIHIISRGFVEKLNEKEFALPIHRAVKKIPYIDSGGCLITPEQPNGVKLETFVFDALPLADKSIIFETLREEEFAPVKNSEGLDSPAVTREMLSDRAKAWLERANVKVSVDAVVEISPMFAICPEDIKGKTEKLSDMSNPGKFYIE